jgi:lipid-A-disaccharide synthase
LAHADVALAASGTVTVEAALLGTPMVTFYKVTTPSWVVGKLLVRIPFYSMVNLIAGRAVVPELMQSQMTGESIAREARRLLTDEKARAEMKAGLAEVREKLSQGPVARAFSPVRSGPQVSPADETAPRRAAAIIQEILEGQVVHVA